MRPFIYLFLASFLCLILSCSTPTSKMVEHTLPSSTQRIVQQAQNQKFIAQRIPTPTFLMTIYQKFPSRTLPTDAIIHAYIEGDGNSWRTKYKLSNNPTPKQPLALKLAVADPHPYVVYIARPCQYTPLPLDKHCENKYWSSHRYAPEVITATNTVLNHLQAQIPQAQFVLIGFSGGASVAALVAAQRKDITGLITVAGDLNHVTLGKHHGTTPLHGSLNPSMKAAALHDLPQQHWSGAHDKIVPVWVGRDFVKAVNNPHCAQQHILPKATHHKGWVENWPRIIQAPLQCD